MIYLKDQEINLTKEQINAEYKYEFFLPIYHYKITSKQSEYLFRNFIHQKLNNFPLQLIILNNLNNFSAKDLYNYIWNLNKLYIDHPNLNVNDFWWNKIPNKKESNISQINLKLCYPFVLRYLEIPEKKDDDNYYHKLIHCPLCPWYTYCPGCIIDPRDDLSQITSKFGIVVDWCYNFAEEELTSLNININTKTSIKEIDSQIISENLPLIDKKQNYQNIKDCFSLFLQEENLEDPLYCHNCRGPENFSKKYSINRLPYVLILSLKRFKYNQNSNFKLRQMIGYTIDLELENKKYELYGVINHYGSINSGHYTAIIKNREKKWIMCNDSSVYEIEEKRVINSNAYILFYISKESPYNFDYIKMMKSLMNNVVNEDKKNNKKFSVKKDNNFFKYEPVEIKMKMIDNIGYVMEENLEDFSVDENYDIYQDLIKEDQLRIDNLLKSEKENEKIKEENNTTKNEKKENIQIEDKKDNKIIETKKDEKDNKNNDNKNEITIEIKKEENEIKENKNNKSEEQGTNNNKSKEITDNKENDKDEIIEIIKVENEIKENNNNNTNENEEKETISTKSESQTDENKETKNLSELNDSKDSTDNIKKEILPEYYKNFVEIKLEFGKAWIHKSKVEKLVNMEEKEKKVIKK